MNVSISGSATSGAAAADQARAAAAAGVAVERELAHDERGPAGLEERVVHGAVGVVEHPQVRDLRREPACRHLGVLVRHADEHAEALTDHADDLAVDEALRLGDRCTSARMSRRQSLTNAARSASALHVAGLREAVHAGAMEVRLLAASRVRVLPLPRGQRRRPAARGRTRTRSAHGCGPRLLIASRFAVASSSPWPPDRNTMPGHGGGNASPGSTRIVASATPRASPARRRTSCPGSPCSA